MASDGPERHQTNIFKHFSPIAISILRLHNTLGASFNGDGFLIDKTGVDPESDSTPQG